MATPADFIAAARTFVGTRHHPGGRLPGIGLDCIGVPMCAAAACGLSYRDVAAYPMRPNGQLAVEVEAQLVRVPDGLPGALPGDILLMLFETERDRRAGTGEPHHLAIYTGATIIHAYAQARKCVEQPFIDYWRDKVRGVYRLKEFS